MDTIDFAETATIQEGVIMFSGRKLEPASAPARNQFGYELGYTWKEVAQIGASIWVEETGVIWCDDPERVPGRFVERMAAGNENFRRIVVEPEAESKKEVERIAAFWNAHIPENQAIVVAEGRLCIVVCR